MSKSAFTTTISTDREFHSVIIYLTIFEFPEDSIKFETAHRHLASHTQSTYHNIKR